jgi:hypothetical protein
MSTTHDDAKIGLSAAELTRPDRHKPTFAEHASMSDPTRNSRTRDGRFAPGNKISQGNLGNMRMKELRMSILQAATEQDVQDVIRKMAAMAKDGDVAAARVFLEYTVGKPVQALEVTSPDESAPTIAMVWSVIRTALGDDVGAMVRIAAAFHNMGTESDGLGQLEQSR